MRMRSALLAACLVLCPAMGSAAATGYDSVAIDPASEPLAIYWRDEGGERLQSLQRLKFWLGQHGRELIFATNGGIFERDYTPLGLYIEQGRRLRPLNQKEGAGNFYLQPNAVFFVDAQGAHVVRSAEFADHDGVTLATQSGPMLLEHGGINPKFLLHSENKLLRSGVGIDDKGRAVFAISRGKVSFYEFAEAFREQFHCRDAMFLDGTISRMYAPAVGRGDLDGDFTTIIAATRSKK